jgi:hypothetical protein
MAPAAETRGGVQALVCATKREKPRSRTTAKQVEQPHAAVTPLPHTEALAQHGPAIHVLLPVAQHVVPAQLE